MHENRTNRDQSNCIKIMTTGNHNNVFPDAFRPAAFAALWCTSLSIGIRQSDPFTGLVIILDFFSGSTRWRVRPTAMSTTWWEVLIRHAFIIRTLPSAIYRCSSRVPLKCAGRNAMPRPRWRCWTQKKLSGPDSCSRCHPHRPWPSLALCLSRILPSVGHIARASALGSRIRLKYWIVIQLNLIERTFCRSTRAVVMQHCAAVAARVFRWKSEQEERDR